MNTDLPMPSTEPPGTFKRSAWSKSETLEPEVN